MSYILDALQRAETERERGAVPGLHTQQLTTAMTQRAPSRHRALWPWLAGFLIAYGVLTHAVKMWFARHFGTD